MNKKIHNELGEINEFTEIIKSYQGNMKNFDLKYCKEKTNLICSTVEKYLTVFEGDITRFSDFENKLKILKSFEKYKISFNLEILDAKKIIKILENMPHVDKLLIEMDPYYMKEHKMVLEVFKYCQKKKLHFFTFIDYRKVSRFYSGDEDDVKLFINTKPNKGTKGYPVEMAVGLNLFDSHVVVNLPSYCPSNKKTRAIVNVFKYPRYVKQCRLFKCLYESISEPIKLKLRGLVGMFCQSCPSLSFKFLKNVPKNFKYYIYYNDDIDPMVLENRKKLWEIEKRKPLRFQKFDHVNVYSLSFKRDSKLFIKNVLDNFIFKKDFYNALFKGNGLKLTIGGFLAKRRKEKEMLEKKSREKKKNNLKRSNLKRKGENLFIPPAKRRKVEEPVIVYNP